MTSIAKCKVIFARIVYGDFSRTIACQGTLMRLSWLGGYDYHYSYK